MVGSLCLFGGNREEDDKTAIDTLSRELREELGAVVTKMVMSNITLFSRFLVQATESTVSPEMSTEYSFVACIFQSWMPRKLMPVYCAEGRAVSITVKESRCEKFAWGYDIPFSAYLKAQAVGADCPDKQTRFMGATTQVGNGKCKVFVIPDDLKVGQWSSINSKQIATCF